MISTASPSCARWPHSFAEFPGHYRLVSSRTRYPGGKEVDLQGTEPVGQTYYDSAGRMWVLVVPPWRKALPAIATLDEYRQLLHGVVAYYGTYHVDPSSRTVTHNVTAALLPQWVGQRFVRHYEFSGDRLTLIIPHSDHEVRTVYERLDAAAV
jgi:hypothetical protein